MKIEGYRKFIATVLFLLLGSCLGALTIWTCKNDPNAISSALSGLGLFMGGMAAGMFTFMYGNKAEHANKKVE